MKVRKVAIVFTPEEIAALIDAAGELEHLGSPGNPHFTWAMNRICTAQDQIVVKGIEFPAGSSPAWKVG